MRKRTTTPLPSKPSAGVVVGGGILGGLEQAVTNRPPTVAEIARPIGREGFERHGYVLEGLEAPIERREPRDRSGARL